MSEVIYCCNCHKDVDARLTTGSEIYPHSDLLSEVPFYIHDECHGYVGTHHKSDEPTKPLGCIPSEEVKVARQAVHSLMDPIWKSGNISRAALYKKVSKALGKEFHTAEIRTVDEAKQVMDILRDIEDSFNAVKIDNTEEIIRIAREADSGYESDDILEFN